MAPRKPSPQRTLVAEWVAAGLGLVLTGAVIAYSVWEGLTHSDGPPDFTVRTEAVHATQAGFVVPLAVRNDSPTTAADVEVTGALEAGGRIVEVRRVRFVYVPGKGEARGGLIFTRDPRGHVLRVAAEGYEEP